MKDKEIMNNVDRAKRIKKFSRLCKVMLQCVLIGIPLLSIYVWFFSNEFESFPGFKWRTNPITPSIKSLGIFVNFLTSDLLKMFIVWELIKLFRCYQNLNFFAADNVRCFRHLSWLYIIYFFMGIFHYTLMNLVFTLDNPAGQRMLSVSFGSQDIPALITSVIFLVISCVMEEGRKLQEEQNLTI